MMEAFCYVGSNSKNSSCEKISNAIKENLKKKDIQMKIFMGRDSNIQFCKGCSQCFKMGYCPADQEDDMKIIRNEMLVADIIIWISPVYGVNVSGIMKNYIDRITSFCHTIHLAGKLGCVIAVSSGGGSEFVSFYMEGILEAMGCNVVDNQKIKSNLKEDYKYVGKAVSENILNAIQLEKQWTGTEGLEANFQKLKTTFISASPDAESSNAYEINYWHDIQNKGISSFQQFLNLKRAKIL